MKKLIPILALLGLGVRAFATGGVGVNPPQSGVIQCTNAGVTSYTNAFAYPYLTAPVVTLYATTTNVNTITNVSVSTTNFVIGVNVNGTTNGIVSWTSAVGATRLQYGTQVISTASTNVTFPYAYAYPPVVDVTGNGGAGTNAYESVTSITTTNFTISNAGATQTNGWISVGTVAYPTSPYTGNFPLNNTVIQ